MNKQNDEFQEAKKTLMWLREMYASHETEDLFRFEIRITLQNDTAVLIPILDADKIEVSSWYNNSIHVKCYFKGESENEKAISFETITKVAEMMEEELNKIHDNDEKVDV